MAMMRAEELICSMQSGVTLGLNYVTVYVECVKYCTQCNTPPQLDAGEEELEMQDG